MWGFAVFTVTVEVVPPLEVLYTPGDLKAESGIDWYGGLAYLVRWVHTRQQLPLSSHAQRRAWQLRPPSPVG
jgi:hypothetical protein